MANSPKSSRERIQTVARSIAERYKTRGHDGSRTKSATFYLLVDLMFFFDLFHQKQNEEALNVIHLCNTASKSFHLNLFVFIVFALRFKTKSVCYSGDVI